MTSTDPKSEGRADREAREPGYRGSLPTRDDQLARPWIFLMIGVFVLIFVLSFLGVPSRFIAEPTPVPLPSVPAISAEPSGAASPSVSASAVPSVSASLEPSASLEASPSPSP